MLFTGHFGLCCLSIVRQHTHSAVNAFVSFSRGPITLVCSPEHLSSHLRKALRRWAVRRGRVLLIAGPAPNQPSKWVIGSSCLHTQSSHVGNTMILHELFTLPTNSHLSLMNDYRYSCYKLDWTPIIQIIVYTPVRYSDVFTDGSFFNDVYLLRVAFHRSTRTMCYMPSPQQ